MIMSVVKMVAVILKAVTNVQAIIASIAMATCRRPAVTVRAITLPRSIAAPVLVSKVIMYAAILRVVAVIPAMFLNRSNVATMTKIVINAAMNKPKPAVKVIAVTMIPRNAVMGRAVTRSGLQRIQMQSMILVVAAD